MEKRKKEGGRGVSEVDRWRIFRKFPRSPMCKYLSGVSGAVQAATYGTCRDAMHQPRRPSASTSTSTNAYACSRSHRQTRNSRAPVHVSVPSAVCTGESCEYMHKNVYPSTSPFNVPFSFEPAVPRDDRR